MKILVFEYITGGGFNKHDLPESLANEGRLMLQALLDNLSAINGIEIVVMLDWRIADSINMPGISKAVIRPEHDSHDQFTKLAEQCDAIWPIAPEFDGLLRSLCHSVESMGKVLLNSSANSVAITSDKFKTCQLLSRHKIATVPTRLFDGNWENECMIKSVDGAGCADSYVIKNRDEFSLLSARLQGAGRYIIQPHLQGKKTSLSCLFKQGRAWLLCVNEQKFRIVDHQYQLFEIEVNHQTDSSAYRDLLGRLAQALPGLWGYAGIDLIDTSDQILVLEINPRLTTSFVGITNALGINVADTVLQLLEGDPIINRVRNLPVTININQECNES